MLFDTSSSDAATPAVAAYSRRRGVCQDYAHIFIAVARLAGHPARYISGHLYRRDGAIAQDAGHAWAEAHVADLGWVAFDPTNGICADDCYVRVGVGLDYQEAAPIAGARSGGGEEQMAVEVQVSEVTRRSQSQGQRQGGAGGSSTQQQD